MLYFSYYIFQPELIQTVTVIPLTGDKEMTSKQMHSVFVLFVIILTGTHSVIGEPQENVQQFTLNTNNYIYLYKQVSALRMM